MRFTVTKKIIIGLAVILLIGIVSMLVIYRGLDLVAQHMRKLAEIEEPASAAAYEMEINVNGMGMAVLKYLNNSRPIYRDWAEQDQVDFEKYHARYLTLIRTPKEAQLATLLDNYYQEFTTLGESLMGTQDTQQTMFLRMAEHIEAMDDIIDTRLQSAIDPRNPSGFDKAMAIMEMESDIAELGFWLANYRQSPRQDHREQIFSEKAEFEAELRMFGSHNSSAVETRLTEELQELFNRMAAALQDMLSLEDTLQSDTKKFIELRVKIDQLLDKEIQILALRNLYAPRRDADQAAGRVLTAIRYLTALFVIAALGVGWVLIRAITRPLKRLSSGTRAIGHGDLNHRIIATGRDEFADLARQFNRMVGQLQVTTVSKTLLEESEGKLYETVADLRREISERERAERERTQLQAALRRSETLSAMGSLVAGVAHEVRNPLFAVSSTLDAMEARFAGREEYQRYLDVLRGEVNRLSNLMQELLEYGKPTGLEFFAGRIEGAVLPAIQACAALAKSRRILINHHLPPSLATIAMDRLRLVQVFQNLLQNAIQHSPEGATVTLESRELYDAGGNWMECTVQDNGSGLITEDVTRIFEPFYTRRRGGTGLGLSIVQRIVEDHKGTISAGNRPEGGAVMTVRLPIIQSASGTVHELTGA